MGAIRGYSIGIGIGIGIAIAIVQLTLDIIRRKNYSRLGCVVHVGFRGFAQPAK